jgi:hypothetical protein
MSGAEPCSKRATAGGTKDAPRSDPDTPQKHRPAAPSIASSLFVSALLCVLGAALASCLAVLALRAAAPSLASAPTTADTLVLYLYSNTEPEYIHNLHYFLREAVGAAHDDRAHYVVIVQTSDDISSIPLPDLPLNARYVYHRNQVSRWGLMMGH